MSLHWYPSTGRRFSSRYRLFTPPCCGKRRRPQGASTFPRCDGAFLPAKRCLLKFSNAGGGPRVWRFWTELARRRCCTSSCPADPANRNRGAVRSEEHTSELQSPDHLLCRLQLDKT